MTQEKGNQTPNTPDFDESELDSMKVDELREKARDLGVDGAADMHKGELVKAVAKAAGRKSRGDGSGRDKGDGGARGSAESKAVKYAQEITSTGDDPERPGRSLVTTSHDVIREWAEKRGAKPATVPGTEHGDHLGVLRFDFPGYGGQDLRYVEWDEWFGTFDKRGAELHLPGGAQRRLAEQLLPAGKPRPRRRVRRSGHCGPQ